jgi:hypothetical protein
MREFLSAIESREPNLALSPRKLSVMLHAAESQNANVVTESQGVESHLP